MNLNETQQRLATWATECFGMEQVTNPKVRALRLLEEAIEFAQSIGVPEGKCIELAAFVYSRPSGQPVQELGGIGVTWLVAAEALGVEAAAALQQEIDRISQKPPAHFAARNQRKCEAGFR